jgi:hypothetical protein
MTNEHPITPPPELVASLRNSAPHGIRDAGVTREIWLINHAYAAAAAHWRPLMANFTDEEIMELMPQEMRDDLAAAARALAGFDRDNAKVAGLIRIILNRHAVDHVRAALAKWGHQ